MTFQQVLAEHMQERGISQSELARLCGTTEATISRSLNGVSVPKSDLVLSIANALNVSIDYLMGRTGCPYMVDDAQGKTSLMAKLFNRCDKRDRRIIMAILDGYMNEDEQTYFYAHVGDD